MKSHPCKVFSLSPLTQYILVPSQSPSWANFCINCRQRVCPRPTTKEGSVPSFFYSVEDLGMLYAHHHGISTPHRSPKSRKQHSPSDISPNSPAENHPVPRPLHRLLHHISRNRRWRTSHITHSQQMTDNLFPFSPKFPRVFPRRHPNDIRPICSFR